VRSALAVDGRPADIGIATTGVAGPDIQDGKPVGTAFIGIATAEGVVSIELAMSGDRDTIRSGVVSESLVELTRLLARTAGF
jgi:nicotinamide-nucleotide amidase